MSCRKLCSIARAASSAIGHRLGSRRTTHTRRIVDENRWRAKRDGTNAEFIAEGSSETITVAAMLDQLVERVHALIQRFHCDVALLPLQQILRSGTSAHTQLRIYNECRAAGLTRSRALRHVLSWLEEATVPCHSRGSRSKVGVQSCA
jgi:glutamate---cysteine ligase / carboxylate-amine ligase